MKPLLSKQPTTRYRNIKFICWFLFSNNIKTCQLHCSIDDATSYSQKIFIGNNCVLGSSETCHGHNGLNLEVNYGLSYTDDFILIKLNDVLPFRKHICRTFLIAWWTVNFPAWCWRVKYCPFGYHIEWGHPDDMTNDRNIRYK